MQKTCQQCAAQFEITNGDLAFINKVSPIVNGKKYEIPPPDLCPLCRQQRRMAFRNERVLYTRKCDMSGRQVVSTYSPKTNLKVYDQAEFWGDKWDGRDYGKDFDFSRPFFEQFKELMREVPHISLYTVNVENSYYTNFALNQKNVYLVFGAGDNEDCMYGKFVVGCKNVVDNLTLYSSELCYESVASENCYSCKFVLNSQNCSDCLMVEDCIGCKDLIACFGLRQKQYCIMNKQYNREEYEKIAKDYEYLTHEKIAFLRGHLNRLKKDLPHVQSHIYASEDCTGESVYNSKNCHSAFDSKNCEDCKYIYFNPNSKECMDAAFCAPEGNEFCYNICSAVGLSNSGFLYLCGYGDNNWYCTETHHCNNVFGCASLKRANYCILNKQYSREEYEALVPRIIEYMQKTGEWGKYFPYDLSLFGYNETIAQEYFPLDEAAEAETISANWVEIEEEKVLGQFLEDVPDDIREVDDDICNKVLKCEVTGRSYKIIPQELQFYKAMKLPIPRRHPDQRHMDRLSQHKLQTIWDGTCAQCAKAIKTVQQAEKVKVLCKECYLKEVY